MNPDPNTAWNVVLTLGVLGNLALSLLAIYRGGQVQKREVTFGDQFVTKETCVSHHQAMEERIERLESNAEAYRKDASESRARLYKHIEDVRRELGGKIQDIPTQVIVTLKNTGAI